MMKTKQLSSKSAAFAKAGPGGMAKKSSVAPAESGKVSSGGRGSDNSFKVSGGKGGMCSFTGSTPAKPA